MRPYCVVPSCFLLCLFGSSASMLRVSVHISFILVVRDAWVLLWLGMSRPFLDPLLLLIPLHFSSQISPPPASCGWLSMLPRSWCPPLIHLPYQFSPACGLHCIFNVEFNFMAVFLLVSVDLPPLRLRLRSISFLCLIYCISDV